MRGPRYPAAARPSGRWTGVGRGYGAAVPASPRSAARALARRALRRPPVVHRAPGAPPAVALTFDDGPSEWTAAIAGALEAHGAAARSSSSARPSSAIPTCWPRLVRGGHEIGNHLWSHADPERQAPAELRAELDRTRGRRRGGDGRPARASPARRTAARPPSVARAARRGGAGLIVIRSVDPEDWRAESAEEIVERVLAAVGPGDIVCLHDGIAPGNRGTPSPGGHRRGGRAARPRAARARPAPGHRLRAAGVSELVSLVMPAWRPRADWLRAAVASALDERGCALELLVVDDGSDPPVAPLLADVGDERLRVLRVQHGGPYAARNAALQRGRRRVRALRRRRRRRGAGQHRAAARRSPAPPRGALAYGATLLCDEALVPLAPRRSRLGPRGRRVARRACWAASTSTSSRSSSRGRSLERSGPWEERAFAVSAATGTTCCARPSTRPRAASTRSSPATAGTRARSQGGRRRRGRARRAARARSLLRAPPRAARHAAGAPRLRPLHARPGARARLGGRARARRAGARRAPPAAIRGPALALAAPLGAAGGARRQGRGRQTRTPPASAAELPAVVAAPAPCRAAVRRPSRPTRPAGGASPPAGSTSRRCSGPNRG